MPRKAVDTTKLLTFIDTYNGLVPQDLIHKKFWPGKTKRAMTMALAKLKKQRLVNTTTVNDYQKYNIPEPVVWIGIMGIHHLCEMWGMHIKPPASDSEAAIKSFKKRLRRQGVGWKRTPLRNVPHDLMGLKFRLKFKADIKAIHELKIQSWHTENDMNIKARNFEVDYGKAGTKSTRMNPDDVGIITNTAKLIDGEPLIKRILLEYDTGSLRPKFWTKSKAIPGEQYIQSQHYKDVFGYNSGIWHVVTATQAVLEDRMYLVKTHTQKPAKYWRFTTIDKALKTSTNIATSPIWQRWVYENGSYKKETTTMFRV